MPGKLVLILFQDTVAKSHPVKKKGLDEIIAIVRNHNSSFEVLLVFLTPLAVFNEWTKAQNIIETEKGEEAKIQITKQAVWVMKKRGDENLWA